MTIYNLTNDRKIWTNIPVFRSGIFHQLQQSTRMLPDTVFFILSVGVIQKYTWHGSAD
jgi:hypothetical protein